MSPVSRKRKPKKQRRTRRPAGPRTWPWWSDATAAVLAGMDELLAAQTPGQLEQATAELLGGVLYAEVQRQNEGFQLDNWLATVIEAAAGVPSSAAARLLCGITAIAANEVAGNALDRLGDLTNEGYAEPRWILQTILIRPTGTAQVLRDAYGTRFGVILDCAYMDRSGTGEVYVIDVDACSGGMAVVGGRVCRDAEEAAAVWRDLAGSAAAGAARPEPADLAVLADLLRAHTEFGIMGDEPRAMMDEYFRARRRIQDFWMAASPAEVPVSRWERELSESVDAEPFLAGFAQWCADRDDPAAGEPLLRDVVDAWLEGSLEYARLACSPHRVRLLQDLIAVEWPADELPAVARILPSWVRWCAERTGIGPDLAARSVAAAERDSSSWNAVVGGDSWFVGAE
ncbi:hypothetical protein [Hamadaea tsunoensis]|uniref:hypothetical protein n=1 Tax=Hamadaea tsunoensis TaxID=53368 RepID=UPI0004193999|nr:hypothetical protein [Hamadaea tsunoensis]